MSFQGIAIRPIDRADHGSAHAVSRAHIKRGWNGMQASQTVAGNRPRIITPFRAVNNAGDYLSRQNYVCGGSNQVGSALHRGLRHIAGNIISSCDGTNVAASVTNNKWVYDSSDYIKYKRLQAYSKNFNDSTSGGNAHNGSYVDLMRVRR